MCFCNKIALKNHVCKTDNIYFFRYKSLEKKLVVAVKKITKEGLQQVGLIIAATRVVLQMQEEIKVEGIREVTLTPRRRKVTHHLIVTSNSRQ